MFCHHYQYRYTIIRTPFGRVSSTKLTGGLNAISVVVQLRCQQVRYEDEDEDEGPQPDATLEQGAPLPVRLVGTFPPELASVPLEDIDPYYHNQKVSTACMFALHWTPPLTRLWNGHLRQCSNWLHITRVPRKMFILQLVNSTGNLSTVSGTQLDHYSISYLP